VTGGGEWEVVLVDGDEFLVDGDLRVVIKDGGHFTYITLFGLSLFYCWSQYRVYEPV